MCRFTVSRSWLAGMFGLLCACGGGAGGSGPAPATVGTSATPTPAVTQTATPAAGSAKPSPTATPAPAGATSTPSPSPSVVGLTGHILTVGPGKQFATIAGAIAASVDGDTIAVVAGTYTNDFANFVNHNITIVGVGGMVHMAATVAPPNLKGFFAVESGLTIKNFEFSGIAIPSNAGNNGAAIRLDGGDLTVQYCYFHDNQDGILGGTNASHVTIDHSEFAHNGAGDGFSHNLYIGPVASLIFSNDYSHDAVVGHNLKSRAASTTISNSVIADGVAGTASYTVDLPNAGVALISNSQLEKGPNAQNHPVIHYGGENQFSWPSNSLTIAHDVFINDQGAPGIALSNQSPAVSAGLNVVALFDSSVLYGFAGANIAVPANLASVPASNTINSTTAGAPALNTTSPWASAPVVPVPM